MVFDPIGLATAIWEGLPYFPPCPGARILSQGTGPGELGGRRTVVDTVVWQCPGGRIVTKVGPVATDPATGRPFPDPTFFSIQSQETHLTECTSDAFPAPHVRRPNILLPKPGHLIAHVGMVTDGACLSLQAIEGALPGTLSLVGIKSDPKTVETVSIDLATNSGPGALSAALGPLQPRLRGRLDAIRVVAADGSVAESAAADFVVQLTYGVPDGAPTGAIVRLSLRGREPTILITDFREGLGLFEFVIAIVLIGVAGAAVVVALRDRVQITSSVEVESGDLKVKSQQTIIASDGVAPIDSGTVITPGN